MTERVAVDQAAKELGIAPETVRYYMLTHQIDIGTVVKSATGKTFRYLIFRDKLNKILGR